MRLPSPKRHGLEAAPRWSTGQRGAVLLEVVLALALFVAAAAILSGGMSSSLDGIERLRLQAHAADLAVSVFSELQMGIKTLDSNGPQPFETPLEAWTWEAVSTPVQSVAGPEPDETSPFQKIEVIIRHDDPALVYRMSQVLQLDSAQTNRSDRLPGISSF